MALEKIRSQVEFYFSDSNFAKDKFMQARSKMNDGFIPISVLLTFKRLKALNADENMIKEAVADSNIVELKDDSLRKIETQEYTEYCNVDTLPRTLVMSGFDCESTLDDIQEIVSKYFEPARITLRRNKDKVFNGSCFVECKNEEQALEALNMKIPILKDEEGAKKAKIEEFITITRREKTEDKKKPAVDSFAEKVKSSFIPKLFKFKCEVPLEIQEIKESIKDVAFADVVRSVIRFKFAMNEDELEYNVNKDGKEHKILLTRMPLEEAESYVSGLTIVKKGKRH